MLISRDGNQAVQPIQLEFTLGPPATSFVIQHDLRRRPNAVTVLADKGNDTWKIVHPTVLVGPGPAFDVTVATSEPFSGIALLS